MGKATRWLKSLLGFKNRVEIDKPIKTDQLERKEKVSVLGNDRRWSFTKIGKAEDREHKCLREYMIQLENEQKKHALAVADAAERAEVAVVGLSGADDGKIKGALFCGGDEESLAALKIQTCFRRHLAKKALRALRSLVKLQAHVRGYLVRKRAAATLHSMQALIRAQATVRSQRISLATTKTNFQSQYLPRRSLEKFNETRSEIHSKRLLYSHKLFNAYEETSNIVEIDTYKPRSRSRRINPSLYDFEYQFPTMSSPLPCPGPAQPDIRNIHHHDYEWAFYRDFGTPAAQYTAQSASRAGPLTPTKSLCEENFFGPSYMADTKSFRAKLRSQSAPKQRPEAQPKKRIPLVEILGARNSTSSVRMQRSCSQLQETFNF